MNDTATTSKHIWTREQEQAIKTIDRNVLVSAAAGSGKTSVLAERCAYLVCDAPAPFRCDIDELLVVTFTVAAASEMRTRIAKALHKRYEQAVEENNADRSQRLARQLTLIDRAAIGTIHSFCNTVIRQHFHLLQIDPNVQMIAEEEGTLLRIETAREVFAERYESDTSGAFQRFIDHYGDGNDQMPRARVVRAAAMLESLVDPERWIAESRGAINEIASSNESLPDTFLGKRLIARIEAFLTSTAEHGRRLCEQVRREEQLAKLVPFVETLTGYLSECLHALRTRGIDAMTVVMNGTLIQRKPTIQKLAGWQKSLSGQVSEFKASFAGGGIAELCRFTEADWRDGMRHVVKPTDVFLSLVESFRARYAAAKAELRVLDFGDLERLALRVLLDSSSVADKPIGSPAAMGYQRRFKHVLVDEYQDVNETQDVILTLVARPTREGEPAFGNFFCVGDVKQSIYRFRLAEPDRFLKRYDRYVPLRDDAATSNNSPGARVDLQTNFRSRANLLSTLNGVFKRLMSKLTAEIEYDEAQHLKAPDTSPYADSAAHAPLVELHLLPKGEEHDQPPDDDSTEEKPDDEESNDLDATEREAVFVAGRIKQLLGQGKSPAMQVMDRDAAGNPITRPLRLGDIAILLRSMKFKAGQFAAVLRNEKIQVHCDSGSGFFETMEVRDMLALLKLLDNRRQDIPLAAVLRSPIAAIDHAEDLLATVRLAYNERGDKAVSFHEAVYRYVQDHEDAIATTLRRFLAMLDKWRSMAQRQPLAEVLWAIFDETGYLAFVEGLDDGQQRVANLMLLHERARQFATFRRQSLGRFMRFLDSLQDESDLGAASIAAEAEDVVRIMSVHASKGLEFPVVFCPDLSKKHNTRDTTEKILFDRDAGIGLQVCDDIKRVRYPSLASSVVSDRLMKQTLAEEMRILYVATTRAREKLILLATCKDGRHTAWRETWLAHSGPLPHDIVLGGKCMMDWIGPALTAMSADLDVSFEVITHAADEMSDITPIDVPDDEAAKKERAAQFEGITQLRPLRGELANNAEADAAWSRLTTPYHHAASTHTVATQAMTSLSKSKRPAFDARDIAAVQSTDLTSASASMLRRPRFATDLATAKSNASDIGTATHLLLEHLDYARTRDIASLELFRDELLTRQLLDASVAKHIDLTAIEWLINSECGDLMRSHSGQVFREVPINIPMAIHPCSAISEVVNALDRTVLRGRVDAVLLDANDAIIIDFKTDRVDGDRLASRVEIYRPQLTLYVDALSRLINKPVKRAILVFLHAQLIVDAT